MKALTKRQLQRQIADLFITDCLSRPGDMLIKEHTVSDKKTGRHWWISNGASYFGLYQPYEAKVGFFRGRQCHQYLNYLKIEQQRIANK